MSPRPRAADWSLKNAGESTGGGLGNRASDRGGPRQLVPDRLQIDHQIAGRLIATVWNLRHL